MALIERADLLKELGRIPYATDGDYEAYVSVRDVRNIIARMQEIDAVQVVRCKDCASCFELADTDPMIPYQHRDNANGFFCAAQDMDFYTPAYNAGTYYCAEGRKRVDGTKTERVG